MIQLNRSMMERYEIADRRPSALRAALFGANRATLGVAARLLDLANERGGNLGAVCFSSAAQALRAQDCMFTLLIRAETEDGSADREERVVQSIISAFDPETEFEDYLNCARLSELELCFLSAESSAVDIALLARFLYARWQARLPAPTVLLLGDLPKPDDAKSLRSATIALSRDWAEGPSFAEWLDGASFQSVLFESLCGQMSDSERTRVQAEMNYRDDFLSWAEPHLQCFVEKEVPDILANVCSTESFDFALSRKARVFDPLTLICASLGFLCGMDTFAQALRDETLRSFVGRAFFDELLPQLPWSREEIAPYVISSFSRLENSMNDVPLLEVGRDMLSNFPCTLLPAIRSYAHREFEAPTRLTLAFAAAVMLYAGARKGAAEEYEVCRGEKHFPLRDDAKILHTFSLLSHDMPSEALAYAVLADRDLWGEDLREIGGLELRLSLDLSSIQRIGLRGTLRRMDKQ